jgi:hypothetical protein
VSEANDFIEIQGQLVRKSFITRLSSSTAAGVPTSQYVIHLADGGTLAISEVEYRRLKKMFEPKTRRKTA